MCLEPESEPHFFLELEPVPEPTQLGRSQSRLRDLGLPEPPKKVAAPQNFFLFDSTVLWCGTPVIWSALRYGLKDSLQEAYYLLYSLIDFYSTPRASDPNPQHWVRLSYIDPNSDPIFIFLMDSLSKSFESCLIQGFGAGLFWDGSGSW